MTNQMSDVIRMADYASAQTDRWLFVSVLILGAISAVIVAKYFVRQHERLIADHQLARQVFQDTITRIVAEQHSLGTEIAIALNKNTTVLEQCAEILREIDGESKRRRS